MLAVYIWYSFNHRSGVQQVQCATFLTMYLTNRFPFRVQRPYSLKQSEKQNMGTTQWPLACAYCIYKIFVLYIPNICETTPLHFQCSLMKLLHNLTKALWI